MTNVSRSQYEEGSCSQSLKKKDMPKAQYKEWLATCKSNVKRFQLTPVKWPSAKSLQTIKAEGLLENSVPSSCWWNVKWTHLHCLWECRLIRPLWKTLWRFLKKLKLELPYDPAIPLLGIYLEKTLIQKDTCTPMFNSSTIYNGQDMEAT